MARIDWQNDAPRKYFFKLCYNDWTHGTRGLSLAARMFYLELCLWSWDRQKPLPPNPETLASAIGVTVTEWADYWPQVEQKFKRVKSGWWNPRVKRDLAEFRETQKRCSEGGKRGAATRWKKTDQAEQPLAQEPLIAKPPNWTPAPATPQPKRAVVTVNGTHHERASFDLFWARYPNRNGKQAALKAWNKLHPDASLISAICSALDWQLNQPQWVKDGGRFVPHASTWLNGRRFEDEPFHAPSDPTDAAWDRVLEKVAASGDRR